METAVMKGDIEVGQHHDKSSHLALDTQDKTHTGSNNVSESESEPQPSDTIHGWRWALAYSSMLSTTFLFALDNTIVADLQPSILSSFSSSSSSETTISLLPWLGTGFALGNMTILLWSRLHSVFNLRHTYLLSILLFEIGSAICGATPGKEGMGKMKSLIGGRVLAGVGGSGMYSGTLTYVSVLTTTNTTTTSSGGGGKGKNGNRNRAAYLAGSTVMWGVGSVLGPVVGGAFAVGLGDGGWRWGFYINLVVGAVFAPAYLFLLPDVVPPSDENENKSNSNSFLEKLGRIDWVMAVLFCAGGCTLTMAIAFGGLVYPYGSPSEIALWVVTGVLLVCTVAAAVYHPGVRDKEDRLYPVHFFGNPVVLNMQLQIFLSSGIILSGTYYVPLYFQFVRGDGPLDAGVRLLPLIVAMVVFSMINGILMPKFPLAGPWFIGGSALVVVGSALMCTLNERTPNANIYGYLILIGVGAGCYIVAGFPVAQSHVSRQDLANAVSAVTFAQVLGSVLFLSICGSTFQNTAIQRIGEVLSDTSISEAQMAQLVAGTSSSAYRALSPAQQRLVIPEVTEAMKSVWIMYAVAAGLSFLLSVPLWKTRVDGGGATKPV